MRILWVKVGGLWPLNSGGRLRSFNMLAELSRRQRVSVVTTHAPGEDVDELRRRLDGCEQVLSIPHVAAKWRNPRFALTLTRSWVSPLPVEVLKHRVPAFRRKVHTLLASGDFDLCVADFMVSVPNVPLGGSVPIVFFAHNVDHLLWKRLCRTQGRVWMRPALEVEWRKLRRYEARVCEKTQLTVAVSPEDGKVFSQAAPKAAVRTIPTGVDTAYFAPGGAVENPLALAFTGSMDYFPNEDGMRWFIADVLPRIRSAFPELRLTIVGRGPGRVLRESARKACVALTGRVEDVRPYMDEAAVYVVPLRIGGGTRLKIFEALAMGKAVVSTAIGVEGLPLDAGVHYLRADDPDDFAAAVIALLRDPSRRRALGEAGQRLVRERFAWPQVAREFERCCEAARGQAGADGAEPARQAVSIRR